MLWNRKELKEKGKALFKSRFWDFVLITLFFNLLVGTGFIRFETVYSSEGTYFQVNLLSLTILRINGLIVGLSTAVALVLSIFFVNVVHVGGAKFFLDSTQYESSYDALFYGFKNGYKNIVYIQLIKDIKIFLWGLLFIIPGIIKTIEYSMIPYLLAENPDMSKDEVFRKSKEMMDGHKWDYFVLNFSFIGWLLLDLITFGLVSIFWTDPYVKCTQAYVYLVLKQQDQVIDVVYE